MLDRHQLEIVIALLAAVLVLATVGRRVLIPYPIFLVLGGLVIGLLPNVPILRLDPELVFLVILPPVLWAAATSRRFAISGSICAPSRCSLLSSDGTVILTYPRS
jgi:NhaP-type Na+/H+ or K+/H+ antiporter